MRVRKIGRPVFPCRTPGIVASSSTAPSRSLKHNDRVVVELDGFAHGVLHSIAEVVLLRVRLKREAARC